MEKAIILRYAEIHLKGNNRNFFENLFERKFDVRINIISNIIYLCGLKVNNTTR